jgi:hypothetical protein
MSAISPASASCKVLGLREGLVLRGHMRWRKFIKLVGGAVTVWPFAACSRRNSDAIAGL